jgi:hypothetical protein
MDYIYRLYTNRTIGYFKNKDDAISLLFNINNAKIEVFQNCTPVGIYKIINNELYYNDSIIKLEGYLNSWFNNITETIEIKKEVKKTDNELNLFIPVNTFENSEEPVVDMEKYLEHIKLLEENAKLCEEKLENMKEQVDTKKDEFKQKKEQFNKEKKSFDKEKEEWNQFKSKLEADKRVYFIIKEQLESGELTEESIPILFQDKYPIFKKLDDDNLLDSADFLTSNDISNYLNILPNYEQKNSEAHHDSIFTSSDPLYLMKKFNLNDSSELNSNNE